MKIDTEILSKIMAKRIQQHIKNDQSPRPNRLHPRNAGVVQHRKINERN
jgi:hypothetical protein